MSNSGSGLFKIAGQVTGLTKLNRAIDKFTAQCLEKQVAAMQEAIFLIHETAVKIIQDNSSGESAIRYGPKRVVNVSRPGDPPNTDTGRLAQSIKFEFSKGGLVGRVGTNLAYGAALEFGTSNMAPRPWLSTALELSKDAAADIFAKAVTQAVKEA